MCYIWKENRMFCFPKKYKVIMVKLDNAKKALEREFEDSSHVLRGTVPLYGESGSRRKLRAYVLESVKKDIGTEDCTSWLDILLKKYNIEDANRLNTISKVKAQYEILDWYRKNPNEH